MRPLLARRSTPTGAGAAASKLEPVRAHFERIVVDGVPAYVGDLPEPVTAGIVFRVGSADESLLEHGLTALVAELAAVDVEGMNWIVYETSTIFFTSGTLSD